MRFTLATLTLLYAMSAQAGQDSYASDSKDFRINSCLSSPSCEVLAEMAYHEARGEDDRGVLAVMFVAMNRLRHSSYPNTLREVIYQPYQFSYTQDGSLDKGYAEPGQRRRMLYLAHEVISGAWDSVVGRADHYHAEYVNPNWGYPLYVTIGKHHFYTRER